ncbi:pentatricopeptide repeat domain-containing protein, putative [Plasmodium vinckei brucechwatti]|uniref:Pentatricopeptide repeat domain-containing protein, putative n=1 Tax=Plasmodium vinckei brucechwatti TaxID=119398 RepID=A0A6V7T0R2_PLAVN|nr:pentatricopeptide repeat domain-containing protein, putative [Plasmodium vinckei brucechwatti]
MNYPTSLIRFKDLRVNNIKGNFFYRNKGYYKTNSFLYYYINNLSQLNNARKNYSSLGQLVDRKKNVVNLSDDGNIVKSYKRVNIKKILKGHKKSEEFENGAIGSKKNKLGDTNTESNFVNFNGMGVQSEYNTKEKIAENREDKNIMNNIEQKDKELKNSQVDYSTQIDASSMDEIYLKNLQRKNKRDIDDENIKNSVDELFYSKGTKKKLMKRLIFNNNCDYMDLINKYQEFKEIDDDKFYALDSSVNNSTSLVKDENKANDKFGYLHEVERENIDENKYINTNFKYLKNNTNISIFSEVGKKEILDTCKRKKNMQNEINKNSQEKNIFNNDIFFWLKRKVHRSIDWNISPDGLNKQDDIIDVTELNCLEKSNTPESDMVEEGTNISTDDKLDKQKLILEKNNENFQTDGEKKTKKAYIEKKISPFNFLKKLNINVVDEENKDMKKELENENNKNDEKIKEVREKEKESLIQMYLNNLEDEKTKLSLNNILDKEKEHLNCPDTNIDSNSFHKFTNDKDGEHSLEFIPKLVNDKKDDATVIDELICQANNQEDIKNEPKDKTYEGIIDNSKNIFKKLKENYELFKKENMSPYILEGCEKYINYYYGIEKEEKIKEMKQYSELNFYDVIKDKNFTIENYNMLIKSKIIFNKEEEAFNYFNLLKKYDFKINVDTYNSLMYTCIVQKNAKLSRLIYLQMIKDMFIPNKNTFCIMIKSHILDNDIKSAFHLYRKMVKEEIEVDLPIYSTLIDGLIKHKLYKRAENFYNYIINYKNVVPDEILYTIMIKNCSYNGEAEKCLNIYETMLSNNLRITDITLIEIINCLSKRVDYFHKVFHFYNIYLANDMKLNHRLMLYMIIACSNSGNIKRLKEILKTMNKYKIKITDEMYCYIIRAFANNCKSRNMQISEKNNNIKYAWGIIYYMMNIRKNNINDKPNASGSSTENEHVNSPIIQKKNHMVNTKLLNSIVLLYINCEYYEYSINMLKYYSYFHCIPDYYTFNMLFKMLFYKQKDYGKVICLYNYMVNNTNIKIDEHTFDLVLNSAIKTKSSKNTLFILRHMFTAKIYPTPKTIKKLFHVARHITDIQLIINSMIHQQKKDIYEENVKENQLIQLNIDEYELNLFKDGKTFKTKSEIDKVRDQFFKRKERIEKDKKMSKNQKSSDWLPYGQYLQSKKKGGEIYAKKVDRPRPLPFD